MHLKVILQLGNLPLYSIFRSMQTDQERSEKIKKTSEGPKVKGELGILDLPPIEDLHISVPEEECKAIGVIKSVVEPLGKYILKYQ